MAVTKIILVLSSYQLDQLENQFLASKVIKLGIDVQTNDLFVEYVSRGILNTMKIPVQEPEKQHEPSSPNP